MAEVTKPIALDESFNTSESTPRNLADVLAEGLGDIAEAVVPRAATEIPIESGSSTNTKDYIDSGLSGKADKTSTSGALSSPVGTLARGSLRKLGDIKFVSFGILLNSGISTSTKILSLPSGFNATINLDGTGLTRTSGVDTVCDFYITGNEVQYNSSGSVASGSYVFGSFWYI